VRARADLLVWTSSRSFVVRPDPVQTPPIWRLPASVARTQPTPTKPPRSHRNPSPPQQQAQSSLLFCFPPARRARSDRIPAPARAVLAASHSPDEVRTYAPHSPPLLRCEARLSRRVSRCPREVRGASWFIACVSTWGSKLLPFGFQYYQSSNFRCSFCRTGGRRIAFMFLLGLHRLSDLQICIQLAIG
jgi:hypothetical protein